MTGPVNHPKHYTTHPSGVECIQITEHMGFCLGNAVKYLWRADLKGDAIEDLRKARWYIDREIARREALARPAPEAGPAAPSPLSGVADGPDLRLSPGVLLTRRTLKSGRQVLIRVDDDPARPEWCRFRAYRDETPGTWAADRTQEKAVVQLVSLLEALS